MRRNLGRPATIHTQGPQALFLSSAPEEFQPNSRKSFERLIQMEGRRRSAASCTSLVSCSRISRSRPGPWLGNGSPDSGLGHLLVEVDGEPLERLSSDAAGFVSELLEADPDDRMSASQALLLRFGKEGGP